MTPTTAYALAYGAYVAAIHAFPQGPWRAWSQRDGAAVDTWTWTHVAWGVLAERMRVPFWVYMGLAAGNELAEAWARSYAPHLTWGGHESLPNAVMDLAANAAGYGIPKVLAGCR